jgi:hypothetical protein
MDDNGTSLQSRNDLTGDEEERRHNLRSNICKLVRKNRV